MLAMCFLHLNPRPAARSEKAGESAIIWRATRKKIAVGFLPTGHMASSALWLNHGSHSLL